MGALAALENELPVLARDAREARLQRCLSLIAGLAGALSGGEVAYEHYRGSYSRRIMWTPVILSQALLAAGVWGALNPRAARTVLPAVSAITLADCVIGFGFHLRGIARKPGGWRYIVPNVMLGPPPFAPLLFGVTAYIGIVAARMQPEGSAQGRSELAPLLRRHIAVVAGLSALFSGVEALYSHYKNNFRYKAQWTPILVAPLLAAAAFTAARHPERARKLLPAASALALADGAVGFAYHARGVLRRPGGRHRLGYNIMYGPPILAPLLFAASGFLGLLASVLRPGK